jgi:hypothetical protein
VQFFGAAGERQYNNYEEKQGKTGKMKSLRKMQQLMRTALAAKTANSSALQKNAAAIVCHLSLSLVAAVVIGVVLLCTRVNAEDVGTSQADLPSMIGRFVIENQTNQPVNFSVRWGNSNWKSYTQAPHSASSHSHALTGPNQAPQPYVRFGTKEYRVAWGMVGYTGFGSGGQVDNSVRHVFQYAADGHLDLLRQ